MFQIPAAILHPASKAQFHRVAETLLRSIAAELQHSDCDITIDSTANVTSSMGTVTLTTASLKIEVYMDGFGPRESPRMLYRNRLGNGAPRFKWLADMDASSRSDLLADLKKISRNAPSPGNLSQNQPSLTRRFTSMFS